MADYAANYVAQYAGLGLFLLLGAGLVALFLLLTWLLGPRLRFAEKAEPFECGESPIVSPYQRFNVKFYMVAVSFIIFDVEMVFLYPWAVVFKGLGLVRVHLDVHLHLRLVGRLGLRVDEGWTRVGLDGN